MRPLTDPEIRAAFVNCSKGEAKRMDVPRDLAELPWDDLDFLGWRDPGAPDRGYIVTEQDDGLVGVALRAAPSTARGYTTRGMCSVCLTVHSSGGVSLMTAKRTGEAGRLGNTVGLYLCADLACPLYLRGKRKTRAAKGLDETLTLEEKIVRAETNLTAFLAKVTA
ncbi:FBP domain-containing protein [Actinocorallia sp. A-T 12471]|uniref:FBP domain-containing protein n=1 Tax=Actinocorallia sp. A-T 12471 TaxID=3089813 RepID=UPI0029CC808A|nr:FBP domain-containing protein [Actinocorallia sp. A-T 12471]MDX6741033.1 FBP domain-containing protein [Actinocorallia sp. A-T 12471]